MFQITPSAAVIHLWSRLLTFGPLYRKDHRLVLDCNRSAMVMGEDLTANFIEGSEQNCDALARTYALKSVMQLGEKVPLQVRPLHKFLEINLILIVFSYFSQALLTALSEQDKLVTKGKTRHFDNSIIHLTKNRIAQVHLILTQFASDISSGKSILDGALHGILEDNQQLSVRYYTEWIIIRLVMRFNELRTEVMRY